MACSEAAMLSKDAIDRIFQLPWCLWFNWAAFTSQSPVPFFRISVRRNSISPEDQAASACFCDSSRRLRIPEVRETAGGCCWIGGRAEAGESGAGGAVATAPAPGILGRFSGADVVAIRAGGALPLMATTASGEEAAALDAACPVPAACGSCSTWVPGLNFRLRSSGDDEAAQKDTCQNASYVGESLGDVPAFAKPAWKDCVRGIRAGRGRGISALRWPACCPPATTTGVLGAS